jgi:hypothetical protein
MKFKTILTLVDVTSTVQQRHLTLVMKDTGSIAKTIETADM